MGDPVTGKNKKDQIKNEGARVAFLSFFLSIMSRSNFDHHLRCGGWLNFEFS